MQDAHAPTRRTLTTARRSVQWLLNSRFGARRPYVLANSIPKSGTHLAKAILNGAGYRFVGHCGHSEQRFLSLGDATNCNFATAHISQPVHGAGQKLLIYRDPADVAFAMAAYIRARPDHPRNRLFARMSLPMSVHVVFEGAGDLEPLAQRYARMRDWARLSGAKTIDFDNIRNDPASLLHLVGATDYSSDAVTRAINGWNPTRRAKRFSEEASLKHDIRNSNLAAIQEAYDAYKEIQSLT